MQVTGTLRNWTKGVGMYNSCYWGNLYGDSKGRWDDGTRIHTSLVKEKKDCGDHYLLFTLNSVYILPKEEEHRNDMGRS